MKACSLVPVLFLPLAAAVLSAQRQEITINTATPEGRLLQQVGEEPDDAKKVALMEQFLAQFPKHEGTAWVYSRMLASCTKLGQYDKALAAAEALLTTNPTDMETAYSALQAVEAKKDPDTARQWAVRTSDLARKAAREPKGGEEDDAAFQRRVEYARRVDAYSEYVLFTAAVQAPEAAKKVELLKSLEAQAPESTYLSQASGLYFQALAQSGDLPGAVALAEKLIPKGQANEEMLATTAEYTLRQNKEPQKVLDYSAKLLEMVNTRQKPESASDADWQKWKNHYAGLGQWMTGVVYGVQGKFADSNKVLREALPLLEGKDEYKAAALYNLGVANSRLKNVAEAGKYYEQCAAIAGPYRAMCTDNLKSIRSTYRIVK
jgi:tetratricopeptide (TPR) repeat protein